MLEARGVAFHTHKDHVVKAPGEVTKPDAPRPCSPRTANAGTPTLWTPTSRPPLENHLDALTDWEGLDLPSLQDMGFERSAIEAPEAHVDVNVLKHYADTRDLPAKRGTTRISVHLVWDGGIRELAKLGFKHSDKWLTELIWRDFYQAIIHAFPQREGRVQAGYDRIPWRR